ISIAVSLIKNPGRFEWFLEKATEIGVSEIIPLICHRTEKYHYRQQRMKNVLISAMLQSRQAWLPELKETIKFADIIKQDYDQKFIAHCNDRNTKTLNESVNKHSASKII